MQPETTITVTHARGEYPIRIAHDWLGQIGQAIGEHHPRLVLVSDERVFGLAGNTLLGSLGPTTPVRASVCLPPGEPSKSLASAGQIWQQCLAGGADRQTVLVALGGGVVGDLTGFAASAWMRGVPWIQIPTTLLAQVDSSVGGKTGINLPGAKNCVGAFWQPAAVYIDTAFCLTLDADQYTSGLAEVVKYGVIMDGSFFSFLEEHCQAICQREPGLLAEVVSRCCELKRQVVEADEHETTGRRAILNLGHTFGHAIEAVSGYGQQLHGHAVAAGMLAAMHLGHLQGTVTVAEIVRLQDLLAALQIPCRFPAGQHDQMIEAMQADKKSIAGRPRFVVPTGIGSVELTHADPVLVRQAMNLAAGAAT